MVLKVVMDNVNQEPIVTDGIDHLGRWRRRLIDLGPLIPELECLILENVR